MTKRRPRKGVNAEVDTGHVRRPKAVVLPDTALVPQGRLIKPPPNQFTHELRRAQPYYYERPSEAADGDYAPGTRVVLMVYDGAQYCRVVDSQGLYVQTAYRGLRRLEPKRRPPNR
jgi:hypothetical protein